MPNWVTTKIRTEPQVIKSFTSADDGRIDFAMAIPFIGEFHWNTVSLRAEEMAKIVVGVPVNDHPVIASMQRSSRSVAKLSDLNDEDFEQFIKMLRNYRKCGFLHQIDFARASWGTKRNACESSVSEDGNEAQFDTAWSCPKPVLATVSKRFPGVEIHVTYADEDIGSNCGTYLLKDGVVVSSDIAPSWSEQSDEEKKRWTAFANEVKGWEPEPEED